MQTLLTKEEWEGLLESNKGDAAKPLFVIFANDAQAEVIEKLVAAVEELEGDESVIIRATAEATEADCMTQLFESLGTDSANSIVVLRNGEKVGSLQLDAETFTAEAFADFVQNSKEPSA